MKLILVLGINVHNLCVCVHSIFVCMNVEKRVENKYLLLQDCFESYICVHSCSHIAEEIDDLFLNLMSAYTVTRNMHTSKSGLKTGGP